MDAAVGGWDDLNPLDVAIFGNAGIHQLGRVHVRPLGGQLEPFLHLDDQVGLAVDPLSQRREVDRRRRVRGVAARRARVHPPRDRGDLVVAERWIVEVLADAAVQMPRGHLAFDDAVFDGTGPGTRFLVGEERHRRGAPGSVALHAGALEDRLNVLREGDGFEVAGRRRGGAERVGLRLRGRGRGGRHDRNGDERQHQDADELPGSGHDEHPLVPREV
ncbi:MAG: hypothetical protein HYZ58_12585 [Acidobacteria bacterium]|nr:hypothetical protein [Acidobacteriota bacterium]